MKNKQINYFVEIAIFAGLGVMLDYICGILFSFSWLNGGSISIAMVPIFMMGFRWGLKGGLTTGILVGVIQLLTPMAFMGGGVVQVLLDYPLAYGAVGLVGVLNKKLVNMDKKKMIIFACLVMIGAGLIRLLSHQISGVVFFIPNFWASLAYNGGYMVPSIVFSTIIMVILLVRAPQLVFIEVRDRIE